MAIDIVARALAVSGKQNLSNYYTKTESDARYVKKTSSTAGTLIYTNVNGTDSTIGLSAGNEVNKVAQYYDENQWPGDNSQGGFLVTATPTKHYHAANKKYVDDNFLKVYDRGVIGSGEVKIPGMRNIDGTTNEEHWYATCVGEYVANSAIALTDSKGHLGTNTPTADKHCANKKYVDDAIASISPTTQTKWQHNLRLEGTQLGSTFKAFMSIPRSDNTAIGTLDELVSTLGDAYISCTGYIYDGNQKSYSIFAFNTAGPGFEYNDPESGGQVFAVANDNVTVSDDPIEF